MIHNAEHEGKVTAMTDAEALRLMVWFNDQ
jgi:hypothetical protein